MLIVVFKQTKFPIARYKSKTGNADVLTSVQRLFENELLFCETLHSVKLGVLSIMPLLCDFNKS